jgi:meso-butanediol dehydrogenase / (S,S)-butanediol dehydrogenase / diacetyl reductase
MEGRVAIVTGGASGMGAATARLLADAGAAVVRADLAAGPGIATCDVTDPAACEDLIASVADNHGRLDMLVNAAGTILRADTLQTTDDGWRRQFAVNVDGTFHMSRAALRVMVPRGRGTIVNFGSIWGTVGGRGHAAYCAAKGAVHQLTKAMALDHARDGIRVNAVCPGEVDTPMLRTGGRDRPITDEELARMADATVPMGRLAAPEEIAAVVVFLCSDAASYITGALVPVDAGYTAI